MCNVRVTSQIKSEEMLETVDMLACESGDMLGFGVEGECQYVWKLARLAYLI